MPSRKPILLELDALMDRALRLLAVRAHSLGEIREKLKRCCANPADVEAVVTKLKEMGYLNDKQFAESFAAGRRENEGFGKWRVLRDLRLRRVAPKLAEQAVEKTFKSSDELQMIEDFLARKYRGKELTSFLAEPKNLASAYRRLRYAGFSGGNSIRALKKYAKHADVLEED